MVLSVFTIVFLIFVLFLFTDSKKPKGYPPGPKWLPLVGCYPLFRKLLKTLGYHHLVWERLAHYYGDLVGLRLGRDRIVLVSGRTAIREVLTREEFDGRPEGYLFRLRTFGKRLGIVFADGIFWQEQRRFSLKHLRNFGFGRRDMEEQIMLEAKDLVDSFRDKCGQPILMHTAFDISVLNVLWAMLAGERFALDDRRLEELLQIVHDIFRMIDMSGGLLNQMPFLRFFIPEQCGYNQHIRTLNRMFAFLGGTIDEHQKVTSSSARDLIDAFLQNMNDNDSNSSFTREQLLSLCLDLFMAGSETTSNTLGFAMLYMVKYPEVQKRVQKEIDNVIGHNRWPSLQDRTRMNYAEAVIMELQRLLNIAPVAVAHRAMVDTQLLGHEIPKNTTLLVCLRSLHMDKVHWENPEDFNPNRFLDAHGNLKRSHDDWFAPFGFGRRRCLGETLARSSLFLFFTSILHNYDLNASPDHEFPFPEGYDGITISPKPFHVILTPRAQ